MNESSRYSTSLQNFCVVGVPDFGHSNVYGSVQFYLVLLCVACDVGHLFICFLGEVTGSSFAY